MRTTLREELVGTTLGEIGDLFEAEGFTADASFTPNVNGERRTYVEQFYAGVDWTDWDAVRRMLRVIEGVLDRMRMAEIREDEYAHIISAGRAQFEQLLLRDGFAIDEDGSLRAKWEVLTQQSIRALPEESAIPGHLRRMWDSVEERPEQAISAAKDAIEATTKHALHVLGIELTGREKFPALVDLVQRELRLHPATVAPDRAGADAIIPALGGLATIANKVDEIRNLYGDGHGRLTRVGGLTSRHSRLVARCADAYVGMILDTLEAPGAPWREGRGTEPE